MNKIIFLCLCCLIFILPLPLGSYRPWAIYTIGFGICMVFICHTLYCYKANQRFTPPNYSWPLLASLGLVIVVLTLQLIEQSPWLTIDPYQTKTMLLKTVFLFLFSWLTFCYCNGIRRLKIIIYTLIGCGVFQSIYATYLSLSPDIVSPFFNYKHTPRAVGSFTYPNFLANYLALCLAMGIGLLISELKVLHKKKTLQHLIRDFAAIMLSNKIILRLALIMMIVGLILTRSRMGNSAFFIALAIVSLFAIFFYKRKPHYLRALIISFFILDLVIVGALFGVEKVKDRLVETSFSAETRDEVITDTVPLILEKPWLGSGGGSFYTAFPAYQSQPYSGYYDNAHNDYIQFAVELGIPASVLLGLMILYCLYSCCYVMYQRRTAAYQGIAFGCAVAIVHMLLHSTVDYSLQAGANSFTFILILTISMLVKNLPRPAQRTRSKSRQ